MGLSENIKKLRKEANISQKKLAEEIGVSQASIGYWEKGQRTPSINAVQKIAAYFGVTASYLTEQNIEDQNKPSTLREGLHNKKKLNPGEISIELTKENFEKYPEYFNIAFSEMRKNILVYDGYVIDVETGKRIKHEKIEEMLDHLSDDQKLELLKNVLTDMRYNPILNTLTIRFAGYP